MNERPIDPHLFRLRSFEASWLAFLDDEELDISRELIGMLSEEVRRWRSIGQDIGYFPEAEPFELPRDPELHNERYFPDSAAPDEGSFQELLRVERRDLTPERLTFLDLFVFAEDERWEAAIGKVLALGAALQEREWVPLDPERLDAVAWSLDGAEPPSETPRGYAVRAQQPREDASMFISPAAWRIQLPLSGAYAPIGPERFRARSEELRHARERLSRVAEWLLLRDAARASLQASRSRAPARLEGEIQRFASGLATGEGELEGELAEEYIGGALELEAGEHEAAAGEDEDAAEERPGERDA